MKKTLFGLVSNESKIPHLMERLEAAHMSDISLFSLQGNSRQKLDNGSRGSMDEQRHVGDAEHHKYEDKAQANDRKHWEPDARHFETGSGIPTPAHELTALKSIELPDLGQCQCSGVIEQELHQAINRQQHGTKGKSVLCTALVTHGMSDNEAHRFEDQIKAGHVLICVHAPHTQELDRAYEILKKEGIKEMTFSREKAKSGH